MPGATGPVHPPLENQSPTAGEFIRELRGSDYEQLLALWRRTGQRINPAGRESPEAIGRLLEAMGPFMLVAEDGDRLVGVALGSHDGYEGFINRVAVDAEHRRRGLARRLIDEAERRLADKGIRKTVVIVDEASQGSIEAFRRMGYRVGGNVTYLCKREGHE